MSLTQETIALSQIEKQRRGYLQLSLTNFDNLLEPEIAAGSRVEVADALFYAAINEAITGWAGIANSTDAFIKLVPAGTTPDTCTAEFTDVAPTWSDSKQGYYGTDAAANHRYIGGLYKDAGGNYAQKWLYSHQILHFFHAHDERTSGTDGGAFSEGAWRARVLNTIKNAGIPNALLSSNQITLPAGVYYAEASAPAHNVGRHQLRLRDTTNSISLLNGTTEYVSELITTRSFVSGRFALSAQAVLELQHYCSMSQATYGLGRASGFGEVEVYADIKIWKVIK